MLDVLDSFKQRITTTEGKKRLKALGIDNDKLLQDIKLVESENTFGYYRGNEANTVVMHPRTSTTVVRHEIEHGVQDAVKHAVDKRVADAPYTDALRKVLDKNYNPGKKFISESGETKIDKLLSDFERNIKIEKIIN